MTPLEGIRVIELANGIHGPYTAMMLADMGADVIKVEPPVGDINRSVDILDNIPYGSQFFVCNRNKRAMCIDLHQERGVELVRELLSDADVLVENMRPGVLERFGLGYEHLHAINPRLIYASATGYGPEGPRSNEPSLDIVGQAAGGIAAHTGTQESGPLPVGSAIADHAGALWLVYGITMALYARERTGEGQHVQSSLLGGQIALQAWEFGRFLHNGDEPVMAAKGHPFARGAWRFFATRDGWVALAGVTDPRWPRLCKALDRVDLMTDERFAESDRRLAHTQELIEVLETEFARYSTDDLLERLDGADQVFAKVATYADLAADPQVLANGYVASLPTESYGALPVVGIPVSFSNTPGTLRTQPPQIDEHTTEILTELGYQWGDIGQLLSEGIVGVNQA